MCVCVFMWACILGESYKYFSVGILLISKATVGYQIESPESDISDLLSVVGQMCPRHALNNTDK